MKKTLILASFLAIAPFAKGQLLLEALEGEIPFTPSEKCLERVKDKYYGDGNHNFIYCAVMGPGNKKWLNLNLGAEYAREGSEYFNPEAIPTDHNDWKAYGSMFQEGRDADGHELGEYINNSVNNRWMYKFKNGVRQTPVPIGEISNQVTKMKEWKANTPEYWAGWQGIGETNPCPSGYQVMTIEHVKNLITTSHTSTNTKGYNTTSLIYINHNYPNLYLTLSPTIYNEIVSIESATWARVKSDQWGTSKLWVQRDKNLDKTLVWEDGGWKPAYHGAYGYDSGFPNTLDNHYFIVWDDHFDVIDYEWGIVGEPTNVSAIRCVEQ